MKSKINFIIILSIYILSLLCVCYLSINLLKTESPITEEQTNDSGSQDSSATEVIYIPIVSETYKDNILDIDETSVVNEVEYTIKAYQGKIGVFAKDDKLIRVIEVYVKTLPKADRAMLEKGFIICGDLELNSIIEDYTG